MGPRAQGRTWRRRPPRAEAWCVFRRSRYAPCALLASGYAEGRGMPSGRRVWAGARRDVRPRGVGRRGARGGGSRVGVVSWWRGVGRADRLVLGASALFLALVVAGSLVWVGVSGGAARASRARRYLTFTACLVTGSQGVASGEAAVVWAGMEQASVATRVQVEFLPVKVGSSAAAAVPYVDGLLQRRCGVVIATGAAQVAALDAAAAGGPSAVLAVVGGPVGVGRGVTRLPGGRAARAAVVRLISAAVQRAS